MRFEEDRQRCAKAGMNGFVAKPIEPQRLRQILARWLPDSEPSAEVPVQTAEPCIEAMASAVENTSIDWTAGLRYVGGNETVYQRLLRRFISDHSTAADDLQRLLSDGNAWRTR